jgi:hypothetical protein
VVAPGYQPYREELRPYDGAMSTRQPPASKAVSPLAPVYPFNEPGQPIVLHDGPVGGLAPDDAPGVVELSCVPDLNIVWRIGDSSVLGGSSDPVTLVLRRPDELARGRFPGPSHHAPCNYWTAMLPCIHGWRTHR